MNQARIARVDTNASARSVASEPCVSTSVADFTSVSDLKEALLLGDGWTRIAAIETLRASQESALQPLRVCIKALAPRNRVF